ncbi:MAG: hypothetical protein AB8G96_13565 [Phycisphaerales bacterium]
MCADRAGGDLPGDNPNEVCVRCEEVIGALPRVRRKDGAAICLDCLTDAERAAVERQAKSARAAAPAPSSNPAGADRVAAKATTKANTPRNATATAAAAAATAAATAAAASGTSTTASDDDGAFGLEPETPRPANAAPSTVRLDPQTPAIESEAARRARAARKAKVGGTAGPPRPCHACGQDLRGVKSGACPECGERVKLAKTSRYADIEQDVIRAAWRQPAIAAVIGLLIVAAVGFMRGGGIELAGTLLAFGILYVVAFITYFALGAVWFGIDSPLGMLILQVLGAYAPAFALMVVAAPLPRGLGVVITLVFYGMLLGIMTDFESSDGYITSAITIVTTGVTAIILASAFA